MCLGVRVNKDKIGNLMILLATKIKPLYHTKLIKLLYLIDEAKVKDNGVPMTWLDYKIWQFGPVAPEVYFLKDGNSVFNAYVNTQKNDSGTLIVPKCKFDDGEFSERDLEIIDEIISKYGYMSSENLVNITHEPNSLWSKTKKAYGLDFSSSIANISNISIDFTELIKEDEIKLDNYYGAKDTMMFKSQLEL